MIQAENLSRNFGARRAVDRVSFEIFPGTVLGFLGPNGAGKTTTIRMLAGYLPPTEGRALVQGVDVALDPVRAQKNIGYLPESTPLYADMTVEDFLLFAAAVRGFSGKEREERVRRVLESCLLEPVRRQTIDTLSRGYRQRTCFAQAIIHGPPVLLLDEPTEGLDPNQKKVVREMITAMGKTKIIVLSTHILEEVEEVCTRAIIINRGRIVANSTPGELKKRSDFFNVLTVTVAAPAAQAREVFGRLPGVERVIPVEEGPNRQVLRLIPREKRALAAEAVEAAREKNWAITDLQTDGGRLDEVFRRLTTAENN
ncbi:MAG: ATP-binding cassette domain-containing protein [Candidatus Aureabacteria bacterium]|nr:ATP-binding cassette domain-containing protein [Candidatus Auribacterota bacterium]